MSGRGDLWAEAVRRAEELIDSAEVSESGGYAEPTVPVHIGTVWYAHALIIELERQAAWCLEQHGETG